MALTIYGSPRSRTMRVLWMAEELGLDYQLVPYEFDDPALKSEPFLALNPSGAVPTIVDGTFALSESLAINLYLAKHYSEPDGLYPDSSTAEAAAWQWSLWAQGHLEPWVQKDLLLADLIQAIGSFGDAMVARSLGVLDGELSTRRWLLGDRFTVADLNVAAVLSPSRSSLLALEDYPQVERWLGECYGRAAAQQTRRRFSG